MAEPAARSGATRAVVVPRFGGPELLEVRTVSRPAARAGEISIAVHAAGVNPVDGQNRADGTWARLTPPVIPGSDFSEAPGTARNADASMITDSALKQERNRH